MTNANKAVDYQNPAHSHSGTSDTTFTAAQNAANKTRLTQTGVARVGTTTDLALDLAAQGKGSVNALGGPLIVGPCHTAFGGYAARSYTVDLVQDPYLLMLSGGDYTSEFPSNYVYYSDGATYRYGEATVYYNEDLEQTEITLQEEPVSVPSGHVVGLPAQGFAAGFGNTIAGCSAALGVLCMSVGQFSLAAGSSSRAFGSQALAAGTSCLAYGPNSLAVGTSTATSNWSCALGASSAGMPVSPVAAIEEATVTISGDVRSRFAMDDCALLFDSAGNRLETSILDDPYYDGQATTVQLSDSPTFTPESIVDTDMGVCALAEGHSQATASYSHAEGYSIVSGAYAHSEGWSTVASAAAAHAEGCFTTASGQYSHAEGYYTTASAKAAHASGYYSAANKQYQRALSSGRFAEAGDSQYTEVVLRRLTTNATPAELTLDGASPTGTTENTSNRFILATGKTYACLVMIAGRKSDGTSAFFMRQVLIKNVSGTVSLEGAVQTVGVDINPAGWTVPTLTADNTNKSLVITVTGAASTNIRWSATVQAQEIKY